MSNVVSLLERIHKEKHIQVQIDGITFDVEIPSIEYVILNQGVNNIQVAKEFVRGWEGMNELHFLADGDPEMAVEFNKELCDIYFSDNLVASNEIANSINKKSLENIERLNKLKKPSTSSSKTKKSATTEK